MSYFNGHAVVLTVYLGTSVSDFERSFFSIDAGQYSRPDEIIVVVDGPVSDGLRHAIDSKIIVDRVKVIYLSENSGPGFARHIGILSCSFDLVSIMDADDCSLPDRFQLQLDEFLHDPCLDVLGGGLILRDASIGSANLKLIRPVPLTQSDIVASFMEKSPINNVTVMFRREKYLESGGYPNLRFGEDYVLWGRLLKAGAKIRNLSVPLVAISSLDDMNERRRGYKIYLRELKYLSLMFSEGYLTAFIFCIRVVKGAFIRFLPRPIYSFLYRKFG